MLTAYVASPVRVQSDTGWSVPAAISVLREGNLDLDEYAETFGGAATDYRVVRTEDGHWRPYFPVLTSLVIAPVLGAFTGLVRWLEPSLETIDPLARGARRWLSHFDRVGAIDLTFFDTVEHLFASIFCALSVVLFAAAASRRVGPRAGLLAAVVLGLGTSLYSSVSRLLWQQVVSIPLTCLLLLLLVSRPTRALGAALGVLAGLLYVARPTNAVVVMALFVFLALRRRQQLGPYVLAGLTVALGLVLHSLDVHGTWLPPYYAPGRLGQAGGTFLEAAWGHWFSPARGLAVYSPILLLGIGAFAFRLRRRAVDDLELLAAAVIVLVWISIASFPHWWGGHSYGPRLFSDALPWAAWLLLWPAVTLVQGAWRRPWGWALVTCALLSIVIHARGATSRAPHRWNGDPIDVDSAPHRVWDWSDVPFLRR